MAVGFAALIIFKKAVRSLPVVGGIAKPLLGAWGDAHTVLCASRVGGRVDGCLDLVLVGGSRVGG